MNELSAIPGCHLTIVDDPSDWPRQFSSVSTLDRLLRCTICGDLFKTAVQLLGCHHSFCSTCIRHRIVFECNLTCPLCSADVEESHLRPNRLLDDIVSSFMSARAPMLAAARSHASNLALAAASGGKALPAVTKNDVPNDEKPAAGGIVAAVTALPMGYRKCTVCAENIPEVRLKKHSESCGSDARKVRLPRENFRVLSNTKIESLLDTYKLSKSGGRDKKIARLREYTHLYNCNLDALPERRLATAELRIRANTAPLQKSPHTGLKSRQPQSGVTTNGDSVFSAFFKTASSENEEESLAAHAKKYKKMFENLASDVRSRLPAKRARLEDFESPAASQKEQTS